MKRLPFGPLLFLTGLTAVDLLLYRGVLDTTSLSASLMVWSSTPWLVALIAFLENVVVVGNIVPGSTIILIAMAASWRSLESAGSMFSAILLGGLLGLHVSYLLGTRLPRSESLSPAHPTWLIRLGTTAIKIISCAHPQWAGPSAYYAGVRRQPYMRFVLAVGTLTLAWYVFWAWVTSLHTFTPRDWRGLQVVLYILAVVWLLRDVGALRDISRSLTASAESETIRPGITDDMRITVVGGSNVIGALIVAALFYWLLTPYYVNAVSLYAIPLVLALQALCAAPYVFPRLVADMTRSHPRVKQTTPSDGPKAEGPKLQLVLRFMVVLNLLWVAGLTFLTGGLVNSPFSGLGLATIVIGQFLAGTRETYRAVAVAGCVLYATIEWVVPLFVDNSVFMVSSTALPDPWGKKAAYVLVTFISVALGFYANRELMEPESRTPGSAESC